MSCLPADSAPAVEFSAWEDALAVAPLLAVDPVGLGGIVVRSWASPARTRWLEELTRLLPESTHMQRLPVAVDEQSLLGELDLIELLAGRSAQFRDGLLARADGHLLLVPMAERLSSLTLTHLNRALDEKKLQIEREGFSRVQATRLAVVALDESDGPAESCAAALRDRLAFHVDLHGVATNTTAAGPFTAQDVSRARALLQRTTLSDELTCAICRVAMELGISSIRAPLLAIAATRAAAALYGVGEAEMMHARIAVRLVLAPKALRPPPGEALPPDPPAPGDQNRAEDDSNREADESEARPSLDELTEMLVAAARAALPADLDTMLGAIQTPRMLGRAGRAGRRGPVQEGVNRGRTAGGSTARSSGRRLDLLATLRTAAPWQGVRGGDAGPGCKLLLEAGDLRYRRFKQRAAMVTIFCVDTSGSAAMHRLAEAKGAVELLLADCYIRRDEVALVAFRDRGAQLVLPPTRSLTRAKRQLAGVIGGGATPLAAGITLAAGIADQSLRRGLIPCLVLLTDARANISLAGNADRSGAQQDALDAARIVAGKQIRTLLLDTSPRGQPAAADLAVAMNAVYLMLPRVDAMAVNNTIRNFHGAG